MLHNRARAEQLGFAALPDTLEGSQPAATPSALHPVTGQDTWYRAGIHVLPEELNAAVLEALAAETAGLPTTKAQTGYALTMLCCAVLCCPVLSCATLCCANSMSRHLRLRQLAYRLQSQEKSRVRLCCAVLCCAGTHVLAVNCCLRVSILFCLRLLRLRQVVDRASWQTQGMR